MKTLDEKGFVFIDGNNKPFWVTIYYGNPWVMYWHKYQKSWVTLREINQSEIFIMNENKISEDKAKVYHDLHKEFINER